MSQLLYKPKPSVRELYLSVREGSSRIDTKTQIWRRLYQSIRDQFPECNLLPFGSTLTGFGLRNADLDIVLMPKWPPDSKRKIPNGEKIEHLEKCEKELKKKTEFVHFDLISTAAVPLLSFYFKENEEKIKV